MKKKWKETPKIVVFLLAIAIFSPLISSTNIGISPATINFDEVMRNGYAERTIVVSVDSEDPIDVEITTRGEISNWLNFSEWNFTVTKSGPKYILSSIRPPIDTPNGNYTGFIRVMTSAIGDDVEGHAIGKIRSSLDLLVNVKITDIEIVECTVSKIELNSVEKGDDLVLKMKILNEGNVRLRPQVLLNIWDFDQFQILDEKEFFSKEILPTTDEIVEFRFKSGGLDLGQYWSDLLVTECLFDSVLTFDILEEGALSAKGLLLSILTKKKSKIKETVPIEVNFKNIGEKEVSAQFKGKVSRDGKIIQILESEEALVAINEIESFGFYFTPSRPGKYVISGRIYYSGKKTFESSTTLDVEGGFNWIPIIYSILIIAVAFLLHKVRKERKRFNMKLKHLR